jgi:hypothetical protein
MCKLFEVFIDLARFQKDYLEEEEDDPKIPDGMYS